MIQNLGEKFYLLYISYDTYLKLPNYNYTFLKENYNNYFLNIVKFNL